MAPRDRAAWFGIVWSLLWAAVVIPFDLVILWQIYHRYQSTDYPRVPGVVTESKVESTRTSEGISYTIDIRYMYEVDGQGYENDRHSYGLFTSDGNATAEEIVRRLPVGKQVDVFYNPLDPGDAVLRTGLEGIDLFLPLFLTPFNLVMISGFWMIRGAGKSKRRGPLPALAAAGGTMFGLTFLLIFVVAFTAGFNPPLVWMQGLWVFIFLATGAAYVFTRLKVPRRQTV